MDGAGSRGNGSVQAVMTDEGMTDEPWRPPSRTTCALPAPSPRPGTEITLEFCIWLQREFDRLMLEADFDAIKELDILTR